ncbi:MAG: MATE family efflux transporter [Halanaerobiales bacterium]
MELLNQSIKQLEKKSLWKVFFKFFICGILFYLILQLENTVLTFVLGRMGREVSAAFTMAQTLLQVVFDIGIIVGIGGSVLISIKLGQNLKKKAEKVLGNSIILLIIISLLVLFLAFVFRDYLPFGISGHESDVFFKYFISRLSGITFYLLATNLLFFIIAEGKPFKALSISFISLVLKVIAAIIYISLNIELLWLGILLNLVDLAIFIYILRYFINDKTGLLQLRKEHFKIEKVSLAILSIGLLPWLLLFTRNIYDRIIFNNFSLIEHEDMVTYSIVQGYIYSLFFLFINSLNWIRPIFGYNYGKENFKRVRVLLKKLAIIFPAAVFVLLIPVFLIIKFSSPQSSLIGTVEWILKYMFVILPLTAFTQLVFIYLQATAKKLKLLLVYLSNILLFIIPMVLVIKYNMVINLEKVLIINSTVASFMFIITLIVLIDEMKKMGNVLKKVDKDVNCF